MKFNLDLNGAEEIGNYIPAGRFSVRIKDFVAKESKNGHPQFAITFTHKEEGEFTHYANADLNNEFARNWLYTFLRLLNITNNNYQFSFTENDIIGKPINIELKREYNEYTDKFRNNLKKIWKFDGTPVFEKFTDNNDDVSSKIKRGEQKFSIEDDNFLNNLEITDDDLPF
ncbi:DUF669 domain-containing protein [Staphylococcus haemolyticus]|uniref:DUF669 domain-containing protein n=1 Tax=Staphylococcus haemolyticus TaxID=1283 RepID=A0AB38PHX3_STAHA|nr:DUF669 domain-containing protein [Staphylococcus haemolyticus]MCE4992083.1 DUF669 domain-containing protein [Staphylococcus haemolyticus]PTK53108.1 DUF669 domain-containing protein [Staphylococcus haemolyticus]TRL79253.1 DUF669 domain-containing protein [Staphylococcus haemolyticus]